MTSPFLIRPWRGRVIAGVCGAIANRFGWSETSIRLAFIVASLLTGVAVPVYIVLWIVLPSE